MSNFQIFIALITLMELCFLNIVVKKIFFCLKKVYISKSIYFRITLFGCFHIISNKLRFKKKAKIYII